MGGSPCPINPCFIASILFRGIDWNFYPTTLLAQSDSCIGGKSSINLEGYKNLVGTFWPPRQVFVDSQFLDTLPREEIKSGIGEILHFYLIDDSPLTHSLINDYEEFLETPTVQVEHIRASLDIKRKVIEIDELDQNERRIFNYGHTFGHAIETVSDYSVRHGQAVTMGMDIANYVSLELGYLAKGSFELMRQTLAKNMPSYQLQQAQMDRYFRALTKDKKNIGSNLGCILTRGPGSMQQVQIVLDDGFKKIISDYLKFADC